MSSDHLLPVRVELLQEYLKVLVTTEVRGLVSTEAQGFSVVSTQGLALKVFCVVFLHQYSLVTAEGQRLVLDSREGLLPVCVAFLHQRFS